MLTLYVHRTSCCISKTVGCTGSFSLTDRFPSRPSLVIPNIFRIRNVIQIDTGFTKKRSNSNMREREFLCRMMLVADMTKEEANLM